MSPIELSWTAKNYALIKEERHRNQTRDKNENMIEHVGEYSLKNHFGVKFLFLLYLHYFLFLPLFK